MSNPIDAAKDQLLALVDNKFNCLNGQERAFTEVPQKVGPPVSLLYDTYVIRELDLARLLTYWAMMFNEFVVKADGRKPWIFFRFPEKFQWLNGTDEDENVIYVRSRFVVTTPNLEPVYTNTQWRKPEGT